MLKATVPAADGVMYSDMTRQLIAGAVGATRAALAARDRPAGGYRINNIWAWHVKADRAAARREACRELLLRGLLEPWYLESFLEPGECALVATEKRAFFQAYRDRSGLIQGVPDALVDKLIANFTFTGTPDDIEGRLPELTAFADAGVHELNFRLHDDPAEAIRLIGERVIPALRAI
jgi:hypothetical protein